MSVDDAHDSEFDVVARWTADELTERDRASVLAGACRGSGSPSVLAWLAESLRLRPGLRLLDVGAGLGGPSAWAAEHYGVRPVAVEPMVGACQGSALLFDHSIVASSADSLPLRRGSFEVAWALGVLDTVTSPVRVLREIRRVLRHDGRLGILAYVATQALDPALVPSGNHFQTAEELLTDLAEADLVVFDQAEGSTLPTPPLDWQLRQDRLERRLAGRHTGDARWIESGDNERAFGQLLIDGLVASTLLHAMPV